GEAEQRYLFVQLAMASVEPHAVWGGRRVSRLSPAWLASKYCVNCGSSSERVVTASSLKRLVER
ncbi:hypothetical protein, partial [Halomonas cupida]|uniref:hypothetical protein n=1 Tax=Halomonas cupida TaxID=44933 RepID=UPI001C3F8463